MAFDCGPAGSAEAGGFSSLDARESWRGVKIPAILVAAEDGARLRYIMHLEQADVPPVGKQWIERAH